MPPDAVVSAIKSGRIDKGRIEIDIANADDASQVVVSIRDNGGGISEEATGKIFEPYFSTKDNEGTGIGLYMSKKIIETQMGGSLTGRNVEGGAEFVIGLKTDIAESAPYGNTYRHFELPAKAL